MADVVDHPTKLQIITKTCLYNFDPLQPHFYIVKLGLTEVYVIFLISSQNISCVYSLEPPRWGGSNEYPQSMFWAEIWKISEFLSEKFHFSVVKLSIYLNRLVFVKKALQEHYKQPSPSSWTRWSQIPEKNVNIIKQGNSMPWLSIREFDFHLPDLYYIKVGLVGYWISICFWWQTPYNS